jgi:hypothetical protein
MVDANSSVTQAMRALDGVMDEIEILEICGGVVSSPAMSTVRIPPQFDSRLFESMAFARTGYVPAVSQA